MEKAESSHFGWMVGKLGLLDLPSLDSVPSPASVCVTLGELFCLSASQDAPLYHWEKQHLHLSGLQGDLPKITFVKDFVNYTLLSVS